MGSDNLACGWAKAVLGRSERIGAVMARQPSPLSSAPVARAAVRLWQKPWDMAYASALLGADWGLV